jgi:hypothetical protein
MNIKVGDIIYLVGLEHFAIFQITRIDQSSAGRVFRFEVDELVGIYDIKSIVLYDYEICQACKTLHQEWEDGFLTFNEEVFLNYIRTHDIT